MNHRREKIASVPKIAHGFVLLKIKICIISLKNTRIRLRPPGKPLTWRFNFAESQACCNRVSTSRANCYRNWPQYGLRWSGWYCNPEQHELCRPSRGRFCGRTGWHNEYKYKWSISILPRSQFTEKVGETCVFDVLCRCSSPSTFA